MMSIDEARRFLREFDHCSHPLAVDYLNTALFRLLVTLNMMPKLSGDIRVLELGAAPYFMTCLLLHHFPYRLELANEPDRLKQDGGHVRLVNRHRQLEYEFDYKAFNVEADRFPYEDSTFDAILYCEIIEHLMHDPTHSLYEIHRVLKPGGYLLLSTPNPFRYANYIRFLSGTNIYPPFSGYGPYARHNREFSTSELRSLLRSCHFEIDQMITAYDPAYHVPTKVDKLAHWLYRRGVLRDKMDVIHLRARAIDGPIYRYPPELYLDVHSYQRILNDNIEMGVNDEAQLGTGFYKLECWPPHIRWTDKSARAKLLAQGQATLKLRFYSGPKELERQVTGTVTVGGMVNPFDVAAGQWVELSFPAPPLKNAPLEVEINLDRSWVPSEVLGMSDTRPLGIAVQRIWLE